MLHVPVGVRSVGKTTWADHLCLKPAVTHCVRFSPRNSLTMLRSDTVCRSAESAAAALEVPTWARVNIIPDRHVDQTFEETMHAVEIWYRTNEAMLIQTGALIVLFVDEARFGGVKDSESFDYMLRCADRETVHVILTMHRPVDILPDFRAVIDYYYIFFLDQPADLDLLSKECSDLGDLRLVSERIKKLDYQEFYKYRKFGKVDPGDQRWRLWDKTRAHEWAPKGIVDFRRVRPRGDLTEDWHIEQQTPSEFLLEP